MYLTVSGVNITPTVFPGTPIWALCMRNPSTFKHTVCGWAHKQRAWQGDQPTWRRRGCSSCHSAVLCPWSGEWGWRPHGCSIREWAPSVLWCQSLWHTCEDRFHLGENKKFFSTPTPSLKFQIWLNDAPSDDDLSGGHPLVELVHVLSKLHVHSNLSANRIIYETWPFLTKYHLFYNSTRDP